MLSPQGRTLLLETLRPPDGYQLHSAIGTTYSLDLLALLTAPLAFTLFGLESEGGASKAHPLALLEAVRRNASKMSIFCQAGQIGVPPHDQLLYGHLERSVIEVVPEGEHGVFHPKVWVLRMESGDPDEPVLYRLLCLSRNLTFDRSWDTALVLDGELTERQNAFAVNHPVGDFLRALPGLAVRDVPDSTRATVELMQDEIRRVAFDPPDPFEDFAFWPLGAGRSDWPFDDTRIDRLLIISPFVSKGGLDRLRSLSSGDAILVSRPESLDELGAGAVRSFADTLVLNERADPEPAAEGEDGEGPTRS